MANMKAGRDEKTLIVGVDLAPPEPLQIGDPADESFRGLEVDLLRAVADALGMQLRFRRAAWSGILEELQLGELDLVCSAATVTEALTKKLEFSAPYCEVSLAVVSRQEDVRNSAADLDGTRIAVRAGTTAAAFIRDRCHPLQTEVFELNSEIYEALLSGRADAAVDDRPIARALARKYGGLRVSPGIAGTESGYAMAFPRGSRLRKEVDEVLRRLERDGFIQKLRGIWMGDEPDPME
jgi:ABC-type amino acid transport substrate-binding protein